MLPKAQGFKQCLLASDAQEALRWVYLVKHVARHMRHAAIYTVFSRCCQQICHVACALGVYMCHSCNAHVSYMFCHVYLPLFALIIYDAIIYMHFIKYKGFLDNSCIIMVASTGYVTSFYATTIHCRRRSVFLSDFSCLLCH